MTEVLARTPLRPAVDAIAGFGRFWLLMAAAFGSWGDVRIFYRNLLYQCRNLGLASIPIAALALAFSGAVTTFQTQYQIVSPFLPDTVVGSVVVPSIILELGTLVTALILVARVGARIAAEIGTMRVTEQIDALEVMGLNSVNYLVAPRVIAGVVMFPVIYLFVTTVAVITAGVVAHMSGMHSFVTFMEGARIAFQPFDVVFALIKSLIFGFIITAIPCFKGFYTGGGAEGVGRSTTEAAVTSCVFVLFANYVCASLLL